MRPYSEDLRERVMAATDRGERREAVAERFSVSVPSITRWVRRRRETGGLAAKAVPGPPTRTSAVADLHVAIRAGSDIAFLGGLIRWLIENNRYFHEHVINYRRRKRDQAPDRLGLAIKRDLLERTVAADPGPADFEGWLIAQIAEAPEAGSVRAMCEQIYLEYRMAQLWPELAGWLAQGAPSDDADPERRRRERPDHRRSPDRWHGTDDAAFDCTCHLPQG